MRTATVGQRAMALSLALLLVSCSATRPSVAGPTGPQDLARYVLLIEQQIDGQCKHRWTPVKDFDLTKYRNVLERARVRSRIEAAVWQRDCDAEMKKCLTQCMGFPVGDDWQHLITPPSRKLGGKHAQCRNRCWPLYHDCNKQKEEDAAKAVEVPAVDRAVEWIKRHRTELLVGTVVVIAGVAFVLIMAGSGGGALVLAPALALADARFVGEPHILAEKQ